jgi:NADPH2:quinone reductase
MMRVFALTEFGSDPRIVDIEVPEPAEGEVRVRVHAASVNGFDLSVAAGLVKDMMEHRFPVVLGKDFAGTVDAVGPDVIDYQVGDRVFGVVTKPYLGDGSFAEYVTVPTSVGLAKLPDSIDFVEGAALGLAGTAALQAVDAAEIQAGQRVLVVGATGGVGNQVVQLTANAGAHVLATAATDAEKDLVSKLGAAVTVDHTGDVLSAVRREQPEGVDAIIHLAGDPTAVLEAVRPQGRFVSTMIQSPDQLPPTEAAVAGIYANPDPATLQRAAGHRTDGTCQVHVQKTYSLDQAPEALSAFAAGTLGKLVITIA